MSEKLQTNFFKILFRYVHLTFVTFVTNVIKKCSFKLSIIFLNQGKNEKLKNLKS